jgi:hypothetical protein
MSPQEPSVLFQKMSEANAMEVKRRLDGCGYWEFWCQNTGKGFFEVSESRAVYVQRSYGNDNVRQPIDAVIPALYSKAFADQEKAAGLKPAEKKNRQASC